MAIDRPHFYYQPDGEAAGGGTFGEDNSTMPSYLSAELSFLEFENRFGLTAASLVMAGRILKLSPEDVATGKVQIDPNVWEARQIMDEADFIAWYVDRVDKNRNGS